MKLFVAVLAVMALALPASALTEVNADGSIKDNAGDVVPFTLSIETGIDATCHYGAAVDDVPDTVAWHKHALVWGPTADPIDCTVEWFGETNVTYGYVQFYERALSSDTYAWGDVFKTWVGPTVGAIYCKSYFAVGLWDSVRAWAQGSADGLMEITATARVLE
jgi:hypothetical protein